MQTDVAELNVLEARASEAARLLELMANERRLIELVVSGTQLGRPLADTARGTTVMGMPVWPLMRYRSCKRVAAG